MGETTQQHDPGSGLTGTRLGGYTIREKIGEGGMGAVYLAHDAALDRKVAIKTLPAELARSETYRKRFLREARALARVKHPNLVQIYTVAAQHGYYFFAMEYVEGESLADRIGRAGPMTLEEILALSGQVLGALDAVHASGILHRDVKSANIMVERTGRVVLMDLGLAKDESVPGMTTAGMILGTPAYMSPEQAEAQEATARSDIYSFGVVLYEMAAGSVPFTGRSAVAVLRKHVEEAPPAVRAARPDLPPEFAAAVAAAMTKNPAERPASARALAALLLRAGRTPELDALAGAAGSGAVLSAKRPMIVERASPVPAPTVIRGATDATLAPRPAGATGPTLNLAGLDAPRAAGPAARRAEGRAARGFVGRWWWFAALGAALAVAAGIVYALGETRGREIVAPAPKAAPEPRKPAEPAAKARWAVLRTAHGEEVFPGHKARLVGFTDTQIVVELDDGSSRPVPFASNPVLKYESEDE